MMYGADTSGISDSMLDSQRAAAASMASAPGAGKQKDVLLWHADARGVGTDPAFAAHEMPLVSLFKAVWEKWWEPDGGAGIPKELERGIKWAMDQAAEKVSRNSRAPWALVTGPLTAVEATVLRLGWRYLGGLKFITDVQECIDLAIDSPQAVKIRVRRSVARWRARRVDAQLPGLLLKGQVPLYAGVRAATKPPTAKDPFAGYWRPGCAASLRSAVSNGQWPQTRLKSAKMTDDPLCQLCGAAHGTLEHRHFCPATSLARGNVPLPAHLKDTFNALSTGQQKLLMTRGLLAPTDLAQYKAASEDSFAWSVEPKGGIRMAGWTVYLDGSFRDGPTEDLGRTGWGLIAFDAEGKPQAAAFGVPPPWIRSIHGAELWALFAAIRCAVPGVKIRSDRKAVVDTYLAGRPIATRSGDEHARLWSMVFAVCEGGGPEEVVWMPAHTTAADIGRARLSDGSVLSLGTGKRMTPRTIWQKEGLRRTGCRKASEKKPSSGTCWLLGRQGRWPSQRTRPTTPQGHRAAACLGALLAFVGKTSENLQLSESPPWLRLTLPPRQAPVNPARSSHSSPRPQLCRARPLRSL